jgi:hypothetical protein
MLDFKDASKFYPCRSLIPTVLFKDIIKDIGVLMPQYGTLSDHRTEEARLCFLAPESALTVTELYL